MTTRIVFSLALVLLGFGMSHASANETILVGFGKRDITPQQPLRLSGYGSRTKVMTGVRDRLFVRAMAIGEGDRLCVMVSVEGIAVLASQTELLLESIEREHSLDRSRLVVCSTHSHAAPQISGGLTNLFRVPPTDDQKAALVEYRGFIHQQCVEAINESIADRKPSRISVGTGRANFAVHRRVIKDGAWAGFGVTPDGPTDRQVRVLVVRTADGSLRGAVFQYACHCTTLGPSFNEVTGDWAGLAAAELEGSHEGATFLPVIGCGADANPEPRDSYDAAVSHGHEMARAVGKVLASKQLEVIEDPVPVARFGYAGISAETPSREELYDWLEDSNINRARWARNMLDTWKEKGRLPESYPAPIHTWAFGKQLAWVFLGGEVVVGYQMRIEQELSSFSKVWVAAYTDDVFAYVAAEDMRSAGGYEVDYSMVYYNQPGRWQAGTEDLIVRRVKEVLNSPASEEGAKSATQSLECMSVPAGYQIELVASEPLVADPVNLAFSADGSVWVVEMGDYPLGKNGGRVKRLVDADGDGELDAAELFLDGLEFPTSALPWRDGVIVIAAPDIFFARDTDGDGKADERKVLLTGVGHANPQHRASGFEWGLDGRVYFGSGDTDTLGVPGATGVEVHGVDLRWDPDSGQLERLPGATQFIRSRDRWGRWFGSTNSVPLFHYPIDSHEILSRNPSVPGRQLTLKPGVAPPVYPRSRTVDRFNDLFAKNRFTSACSSVVLRGAGLGEEMLDTALVCEPVHNLVARFKLRSEGPFVTGYRFEEDQTFDFLTSSDTWSRLVRAIEAPDGSLWVVDMYRKVIEHPQWIPDAWQERLNVRAGEQSGRIYRVTKSGSTTWKSVNLEARSISGLVEALQSSNAIMRDLASQQLFWRAPPDLRQRLLPVLQDTDPAIRLQAFGLLCAAGMDTRDDWRQLLRDEEPQVVAWGIRLASRGNENAAEPLVEFSRDPIPENPAVRLALLVALVDSESSQTIEPLRSLVAELAGTDWAQDAMSLAVGVKAPIVFRELLNQLAGRGAITPSEWQGWQQCIGRLWLACNVATRQSVLDDSLHHLGDELTSAQWMILLVAARANGDLAGQEMLKDAAARVRDQLADSNAPLDLRLRATQLLGSRLISTAEQLNDLRAMLRADQPGAVREAALAAAYQIEEDETAAVLLSAWHELVPAERRTAGATLLQRRNWTRALVEALENGSIQIRDLDAATLSGLQNYQDYNVMKRLGTLLAKPSSSERQELIRRYIAQIEDRKFDATTGKKLFGEHCGVCHRQEMDLGEEVASVGPAVANLKKWSTAQWVTAVLDPNATVESKFQQYRALTKSGQIFAGVVQEQQDLNIKIGLADGKMINLARSEIERLENTRISMMPEGFEAKLSPDDLGAIISFLRAK